MNNEADPQLSIVIPAFNEAARLPKSLRRIFDFLAVRSETSEVIVVDDGSTDGTGELTRKVAPQARVVQFEHNRGKGAAVRAGVLASRGKRVLITDADLSSPIEELDRLATGLGDAPVIFGSRALRRELIGQRQPRLRDWSGRVFNLTLKLLGVRGIADTQCGFKLLDGRVARELFAAMTIDRFAFDVELLLRARHAGYTVAEVPVIWNHVEDSRVRMAVDAPRVLLDVLRIQATLRKDRKRAIATLKQE